MHALDTDFTPFLWTLSEAIKNQREREFCICNIYVRKHVCCDEFMYARERKKNCVCVCVCVCVCESVLRIGS